MKDIKTVLYNALSLAIDQTYDQYDDKERWLNMFLRNLGVTGEELQALGIKISPDGEFDAD